MKILNNKVTKILYLALASLVITFVIAWLDFSIFQNTYTTTAEIWNRWDTRLYLKIAEYGYKSAPDMSLIATLPLYSGLIHLASYLLDSFLISSLVISNLCFIVALIYLYKLVRLDYSEKVAWRSIFYVSIFPTAYFLHAGYAESLFIMLMFMSIYFARKGKWLMASVIGIFVTLTRINGIVFFPYMLIEYLYSKKFNFHSIKKDICWIFLIPFGFLYYLLINYQSFGDPFAFLTSFKELYWEYPTTPWHGLIRAWQKYQLLNPADWIIEGGFVVVFWLFMLFSLLKLPKSIHLPYRIFGWLNFLFVSSTPTWSSMPRFALTFFPIFIVMALWGKNGIINFVIISLSLLLQSTFLILFIQEHWAF